MTRGVRFTSFLALAIVAAIAIFVAREDGTTSAQPPFSPGGAVCYEVLETMAYGNESTTCDGDNSPGAVSDIHSTFCIGWNQDCTVKDSPVTDSNFGLVVGFTPPEVYVPTADEIPLGAIVGRLTSEATLGLLNNPCSTIIQVAFTLMNASVNINDTLDPKPVGDTDVLEPFALDTNGNGLPDGVDRYPSFLNETFDGKQPRARYFGITKIQGNWVSLNFMFFDPGTTFETLEQTVTLDPALGVASITVLNDPEAPAAAGPISDFCAPLLSDNVILGQTLDNPCTPEPVAGAACPGGGTPIFENRGYPLFPCETGNAHDSDGDGVVNDGCPLKGSVAESGAQCQNNVSDDPEDSDVNDGCPQVGDVSEGERIPGTCSGTDEGGCILRQNPTDVSNVRFTTLTASQRDADGDGIENSLDVCWDDPNPEWDPRTFDQVNDSDGDGLPNACDPEPNTAAPQSPPGCKAGIVGSDYDQDCYSNRQDNCPTVNQLENPDLPPHEETNVPVLTDTDSDGIGDACDPDPECAVCQGEPKVICVNMNLPVGGAETRAVGVYDSDESLGCATSEVVPTGPTPQPTNGNGATPAPTNGNGNGNGTGPGGVGGPGESGIGSLSPVATNPSVWAIALAVIGGIGVIAGVRLLRARRIDNRD